MAEQSTIDFSQYMPKGVNSAAPVLSEKNLLANKIKSSRAKRQQQKNDSNAKRGSAKVTD